jgi:transposase
MLELGGKFRFYPDKEQEGILSHTFGRVRFLYNHFLFLRQESYIKEGKKINTMIPLKIHLGSYQTSKKNKKEYWNRSKN